MSPAPAPPHPSITCQVCGESRPDSHQVGCAACGTLHHLECWLYAGGCTTYACGCRETERALPDLDSLAALGLEGELRVLRERPQDLPPPDKQECCGYCHRPAGGAKATVLCSCCGSAYHRDCWLPNRGCKHFDCRGKYPPPPPGSFQRPHMEEERQAHHFRLLLAWRPRHRYGFAIESSLFQAVFALAFLGFLLL